MPVMQLDINYTGNPVRLYITLILKVKINIKVQIIEFNCYLFLAIIIIAILLEGERWQFLSEPSFKQHQNSIYCLNFKNKYSIWRAKA